MQKFRRDSHNWLLAEFLDPAGYKITASSDGGTTVTMALVDANGTDIFRTSTGVTYDANKTMTRADGTQVLGCWKRLCTPAECATKGVYTGEAIAVGTTQGIRGHLYWTVQIIDKENP